MPIPCFVPVSAEKLKTALRKCHLDDRLVILLDVAGLVHKLYFLDVSVADPVCSQVRHRNSQRVVQNLVCLCHREHFELRHDISPDHQ